MKTAEEINRFLIDNGIDEDHLPDAHIEWTSKEAKMELCFGDKPSKEEMQNEDFGYDDEANFDSVEDLLHSIENYNEAGLFKPLQVEIWLNGSNNKLTVYKSNES